MNYENEINQLNKRVDYLNKSMRESVDQVLELTKLMGVFSKEFIKFQEMTMRIFSDTKED